MCPVLEGILEDLAAGVPVTWLSARFHNKRLTEQLQRMFAEAGILLFAPGHIPCNDGGVAVEQLTIAASRKRQL